MRRASLVPKQKKRPLPPPLPGEPFRRSPYLRHEDLAKFNNLLFAARIAVEGIYAGKHRSPFKGASPEFIEYRNYAPGDPLDSVDWKAFARTDRYYIKLTQKETDMNCYLLLDCSGSMAYSGVRSDGEGLTSKFDFACLLAAAMSFLVIKQGDKASLTLFDKTLRRHIPCGGTFGHLHAIVNELDRNSPADHTAISQALRKMFRLCTQRGLLVVISDFYDDPADIFSALNLYSHRKFEILLFHVLHEQERNLPNVAHARLVDMETGGVLTCRPEDLQRSYEAKMREFVSTMKSSAAARGIDYNLVTTDMPYDRILRRYLLKRDSVRA